MKKTAILAAASVLALAASAGAAEPKPEKVWEATGFAQPESVLWDPAAKALYVSNVNGVPNEKDGNGFISKLSPDGKVLVQKWATGLDAPKGMAVFKGRLYVSDIDRLVVIDTASGKMTKTYAAPGAKFLNDVTVDDQGAVYVSDMLTDTLWRLAGGRFDKWLTDAQLESPNGLKAERGRIVVASWGPMTGNGFETSKLGSVKVVSTADKTVRVLSPAFGNLDGIEPDGKGGYLVSDWMNGGVFRTDRQGRPTRLLSLDQGSADIGAITDQKLLVVPMMMHAKVVAYRLP
ncbi:MAG: SMP-30/gluconolactonase/LRE family protein [Solirubrobacterales bacterium]